MIEVAIVDDHALVASGIQRLLELDPRIRVVGVATTIREGRALCGEKKPQVIILDLKLPDSEGIPEIKRFHDVSPESKIVVLTGYGAKLRSAANAEGADAFLTKDQASEVLADTVVRLIPGAIARGSDQKLSERERQVAKLVATGLTNAEVARELSLSTNTIKTHLSHVLEKLDLRDRIELALKWQEISS